MPPISDITLMSISDSSNTNTSPPGQDDVSAVQNSIIHLTSCVERLELVKQNEYMVIKSQLVNWEGKLKTVFNLSESTESSQQLCFSITKELGDIQNAICAATWSISRALINTRRAFAWLWDSLFQHSTRYAADQTLRNSCYTFLMYSTGEMGSVMEWVKEIIYHVGIASYALTTRPDAYQVALNHIQQVFGILRRLFQQEHTAALPQQLPVHSVSIAVQHIKESIGHGVSVPDVIAEGMFIKFVWPV